MGLLRERISGAHAAPEPGLGAELGLGAARGAGVGAERGAGRGVRRRAANVQCAHPVAPGKRNADHEMTGASLAGGTVENWSYPKKRDLTADEKQRGAKAGGGAGKGGKGERGKGKGKGKGKGHGLTHGKPRVGGGDGARGKISGPNKGVIKVAPQRAVDSARPSWLD